MLHVVTNDNCHLYRKQLAEVHLQRFELFVKVKKWKLQVRDGGEYDEGDDERAVYLLALDDNGYCHSSIRVRPAHDFSYLIDNLPEWVSGDAEAIRRNPGVWEMARWIAQGEDRSVGQEMRIGLIEYLLGRGASQCLACGDLDVTAYGVRTGWRVNFLGIPRRYPEGGVAVATSLPITAAEADHVRSLYSRKDLFLMEVPADASWSHLPLTIIERAYKAGSADAASLEEAAATADALLRHDAAIHSAA